MPNDDRGAGAPNFTPADENQVLRSMQTSLAMSANLVAATRGPVEQLAQDHKRHLRTAITALGEVARLPSDQKPSAASSVVFGEAQNAIKDVGAAVFTAMIFAVTDARRTEEEMRKNRRPFGMAAEKSKRESPFDPPASEARERSAADAPRDAPRAEMPAGTSEPQLQQRHFAVRLDGGPLEEGCTVFVSCSLVLRAPSDARTATAAADFDLAVPKVAFVCSVEGFSLESVASASAEISAGRDTDAVVFRLKVHKANRYRITITSYQGGVIRGQLVVDDPAAYLPQPANGRDKIASADQHPALVELSQPAVTPSLSLDLYGPSKNILGSSPHHILNWNAIDLGNWRKEAAEVQDIVRSHVAGLYARPPAAGDVDHEFLVLGDRIAKVIPERLADALADPRLDFLAMQVTSDFDFPLDLCKVETSEGEEQLVQDRMAVARWFANTRALKLNWTHRVSDIALVIGKMKRDATVEREAFDPTTPACFTTFNTRQELIDKVFKTNRFNLMHYFGHSGGGEEKGPRLGRYLSLAKDKETLRLQEIGARHAHRRFFGCNPIIVLNCCDGVQPSALLGGPESFPHCFIDNACVACVGSIWPVDSRAGNRFMTALYTHLANGDFFHEAVKSARDDLLKLAKSTASPNQKLALTLAARAYVYFGPPDLRCTFVGRDA